MAALRVAVCTNRSPAAAAGCVDALAAQGAEVLLVASGLGHAAADDHRRAAAARGGIVQVLCEPRPGLARARNRALAECGDDELLAFVDDDATVGEGWLPALARAWAQAPAATACIGGPIRPRFVGGRPEWLSDRLLVVVTALDYGPLAFDLDPERTTVFGANVSFRVGPLRAVGGFDESLGHAGGRIGFGEEDAAERALAHAGWRVRYEPAPHVFHAIAPERVERLAFLRRRLRYGAALRAQSRREPARALRQALSSAAGTPLAAVRGDGTLAMERATRAAENLGVLLAPLISRR